MRTDNLPLTDNTRALALIELGFDRAETGEDEDIDLLSRVEFRAVQHQITLLPEGEPVYPVQRLLDRLEDGARPEPTTRFVAALALVTLIGFGGLALEDATSTDHLPAPAIIQAAEYPVTQAGDTPEDELIRAVFAAEFAGEIDQPITDSECEAWERGEDWKALREVEGRE